MKGRLAADDIGELQVEVVEGFVSHNTEFSVHGNPLKSFRQESGVIVFMFDDHFSCFGRLIVERHEWKVEHH